MTIRIVNFELLDNLRETIQSSLQDGDDSFTD